MTFRGRPTRSGAPAPVDAPWAARATGGALVRFRGRATRSGALVPAVAGGPAKEDRLGRDGKDMIHSDYLTPNVATSCGAMKPKQRRSPTGEDRSASQTQIDTDRHRQTETDGARRRARGKDSGRGPQPEDTRDRAQLPTWGTERPILTEGRGEGTGQPRPGSAHRRALSVTELATRSARPAGIEQDRERTTAKERQRKEEKSIYDREILTCGQTITNTRLSIDANAQTYGTAEHGERAGEAPDAPSRLNDETRRAASSPSLSPSGFIRYDTGEPAAFRKNSRIFRANTRTKARPPSRGIGATPVSTLALGRVASRGWSWV